MNLTELRRVLKYLVHELEEGVDASISYPQSSGKASAVKLRTDVYRLQLDDCHPEWFSTLTEARFRASDIRDSTQQSWDVDTLAGQSMTIDMAWIPDLPDARTLALACLNGALKTTEVEEWVAVETDEYPYYQWTRTNFLSMTALIDIDRKARVFESKGTHDRPEPRFT